MIHIERHCLYTTLDETVLREYSAFKLGDRAAVQKYTDLLIKKLEQIINPGQNYVLWGTHKKPYTQFCRKNCTLVDEIVSKKTGLPFVVAEYEYTYDPKNFYDNDVDRKTQYQPVLRDEDRPKVLDATVIFFDDSIVKGSVLKTSAHILDGLACKIIFISGIDLSKGIYIEQQVNDVYVKAEGVPGLIRIIQQPGYVFTTHMMRTIYALTPDEQRYLLAHIAEDARKLFLKGYQIQFEQPFTLV